MNFATALQVFIADVAGANHELCHAPLNELKGFIWSVRRS
jgi:hypothetical protein